MCYFFLFIQQRKLFFNLTGVIRLLYMAGTIQCFACIQVVQTSVDVLEFFYFGSCLFQAKKLFHMCDFDFVSIS